MIFLSKSNPNACVGVSRFDFLLQNGQAQILIFAAKANENAKFENHDKTHEKWTCLIGCRPRVDFWALGTLTYELMQDEQKADGHVLDLEIKISDLKYELGV